MFNSYQLNDRLVVDRFDDYWRGPEAYPGITFRIIPETSTRVQALLAGEVSGINGIGVEDIGGSRTTSRPRSSAHLRFSMC